MSVSGGCALESEICVVSVDQVGLERGAGPSR